MTTDDKKKSSEPKSEPKLELRLKAALEKRTLIENLKAGDREAWGTLYTMCGPTLRKQIGRSLARYELGSAFVGDIENEVWSIFKAQIDEFEWLGEDKLNNLLASIALKRVQTLHHKEQRHRAASLDELAEREGAADQLHYQKQLYTESAEDRAEREELRRQLAVVLERALRELSARDREIVVARLILKEQPADIARRYTMKITNVYQVVNRAKKTMRAYLLAMGLFNADDDGPGSQS
jgi:RNA polymerase sigma factor (sigma-70 family)